MRRRWILAIATVALVCATIGLAAHYYAPGSVYTLALAAFSAYLGLGSLVAAVLFALVRTRSAWAGFAVAVVVATWMVALHAPGYVATAVPAHGADLEVMTSNLKIGNGSASSVVAAVRSRHVDVLMLEELTPDARAALHADGLDALLPHSVVHTHLDGSGTGLWSRLPLQAPTVRQFGCTFITARVELSGEPVTLAALHVYGPYPQAQFGGWRSDMREYQSVLRELPGGPTVVGGDFNATTDDVQFRTILAEGFDDAAAQAGAGFTPTWPADRWVPPMIAIDHVLTRGAVARAADSIEIPGSDHRALVVSVRIPRGG